MDQPPVCTVCSSEEPKYKCPVCRLPYCCSNCCQAHKPVCSGPVTSDAAPRPATGERRVLWDESSEQLVSAEALSWLGESHRLRRLLENKHLRDLVQHADSTPNPEEELKRLMVEPLFVEFADECIRVVEGLPEPLDDSDGE